MFLFPLIYLGSFFYALKQLFVKNKPGVFIFLIFGLPIYTTSLALALQSGFGTLLPFMQPLKEIIILIAMGVGFWEYKGKFQMQTTDYLVLSFFLYTFLYVILPVGTLDITGKLISFKSCAFFCIVYLAGRLIRFKEFYVSKYFNYFLIITIASTMVVLYEIIRDEHFHSLTGYADYNFYIFNQEPSGNHGLTWTFESPIGKKRFSSFFANPLEFAASTLIGLAIMAGLYTRKDNRIAINSFGIVAVIASQLSIVLAISRASLASYFIMIFFYALITKNKLILKSTYLFGAISVLYTVFFLTVVNPDLYTLVMETVTFTDASSVGHVIAWINAIEAIAANPMGMGLGTSGIHAESAGGGVGGENQFLILGVQTGLITVIIYIAIYIQVMMLCWKWFSKLSGNRRSMALTLLLMKIGFIIPIITSELESSAYISYTVWMFTGIFVGIVAEEKTEEAQKSLKNEPEN